MAASYNEKRDSQGRVRVELSSHLPGWVWSAPFVVVFFLYVESNVTLKLAIVGGLAAFGVLFAWFSFRRKSVRFLINPAARTLGIVEGPGRGRIVKMDDVQQTRVDAKEVDMGDDDIETWYRVELLLRSTEIVPLADHGRFKVEDCNRLVARIDIALRSGRTA